MASLALFFGEYSERILAKFEEKWEEKDEDGDSLDGEVWVV